VESGKTRDLAGILGNLVDGNKRTLLVVRDQDAMIRRAGKNIPWLKIHSYNRLSAHELLYGRNVLVLESAAGNLNEFYAKK
jgi:large subunit ribosomal protein L4